MSRPRILCVDDEQHVLDGLRRVVFRSFEVVGVTSGEAALAKLDAGEPFEAVVSDMRMPNMNGAVLLEKVRARRPELTRLLLTGYADIDSAIAAVNRGGVFRFLTKPCPPEQLLGALTEAAEQYRLVTAEKVLLEQTLLGSVRALSEVLALVHPEVFGPSMLQHARARALCERLGVDGAWRVEVASMLSSVGYAVLPSDVASKLRAGAELDASELAMTQQMPGVVERVLSLIPRLESVSEVLAAYEQLRHGAADSQAPAAAQALYAVSELGALEACGRDTAAALRELRAAQRHTPELLEALSDVCLPRAPELRSLALSALESGMTLAQDVRARGGTLLIARGAVVSEPLLQRLRNYHQRLGVVEPILCEVPAGNVALACA